MPRTTLLALLGGVFTVSVGYGFVLPVLPFLVEHLAATTEDAVVSRHTGLLTGVYMMALFLFSPFWGWLSDQWGSRRVMVLGLVGFGSSLAFFTLFDDLLVLYLGRFVDGLFASAVLPTAQAFVAHRTPQEKRARRLSWLYMASVAGFLTGPLLGGLVTRVAEASGVENVYDMPFVVTAALAYLAAIIAAAFVPRAYDLGAEDAFQQAEQSGSVVHESVIPTLLLISLIVAAGLGAFEVSLALRSKLFLGMTPFQIGLMFIECSLVMFMAQAIVFSPLVKSEATRWLIAPALALMAAGLFAMPWTESLFLLFVLVGMVAASVGILYPIATYWVSTAAGKAQGRQLGRNAAAMSLGQAIGSAAGGLLFGSAYLPEASVIMAVALLIALVKTRNMPSLLAQTGGTHADTGRFPIEATDVERHRGPHAPL